MESEVTEVTEATEVTEVNTSTEATEATEAAEVSEVNKVTPVNDYLNRLTNEIILKIKDYNLAGFEKKEVVTKLLLKDYPMTDIIKAWKSLNGTYKPGTTNALPELRLTSIDELKKIVIDTTKKYIEEHDTILTFDNDEALIFIDGYYHLNGEKIIHNKLLRAFKEGGQDINFSADRILDIIRGTVAYIEREDFKEPEGKINVKNGVLDLKTKTLEPHDSKYRFLHKYKWDYIPGQDCPKIKKFLRESVASDDDYLCLQEYIGYCLHPDYIYDVFLVLFGKSGHNHKSKTLSLIREFLGNEVVSSISPEDIQSNRFASSGLYGMKANISAEITRKVSLGHELKKLLGHDVIHAEKKFKGPFEFYNQAKIVFAWNEMPEVTSPWYDAFWNKPIVLEFSKSFKGEDSARVMREILSPDEMSGFLNFAIEGLERLLENNTFTYDIDMTFDRWQGYRDIKNPVIEFFDDCVDFAADGYVTKSSLYTAFEEWCNVRLIHPDSKKHFGRYIKDMYAYKNNKITEGTKVINSNIHSTALNFKNNNEADTRDQQKVWKGIKLRYDRANNNDTVLSTVENIMGA